MAEFPVSICHKHTCTFFTSATKKYSRIGEAGPLLVAMQLECTLCFLFRQVWANVQYLVNLGAAQKLRYEMQARHPMG